MLLQSDRKVKKHTLETEANDLSALANSPFLTVCPASSSFLALGSTSLVAILFDKFFTSSDSVEILLNPGFLILAFAPESLILGLSAKVHLVARIRSSPSSTSKYTNNKCLRLDLNA